MSEAITFRYLMIVITLDAGIDSRYMQRQYLIRKSVGPLSGFCSGTRAAPVPPEQAGPDLRPPPALGEVVRVDQRFSATSVGRPQLQAQAQEKPSCTSPG